MRRLAWSLAIAATAVLILVTPATAGVSWCRADPIVLLNGAEVQIWVAIPEEYERLVTGPALVTISTPPTVDTEVVHLDAGFNGHGEEVVFKRRGKMDTDGSFDVDITVTIPIDIARLRHDFTRYDVPTMLEIVTSDGQRIVVENAHFGAGVTVSFWLPGSS
jgi:hypothetical protein